MKHLTRIVNTGEEGSFNYEYAKRNIKWLVNRKRMIQRLNNEPQPIEPAFKTVPVSRKPHRTLLEISKDFLKGLLI